MKKYNLIFGEGSKINQLICAILINLPVFAYGASIGWMSPMSLLLQSKDSPRGSPLSDSAVSWMGAAAYLTCIPANYLIAYIGDRIGRKIALLFVSLMSLACWVTKLSSLEPWAFILARALVGVNMAGCYVICPLYTKEISEDSIRGFLGSLVILFHTFGNLFLYVIGDIMSYQSVLWICLAMPVLHLVLFLVMPESPSYLVKKGKLEEAARVLSWLRCRRENDSLIIQELENIKTEQKNDEESSQFVLKAILTDKILFRAFRIAMLITLAREVCGAIPVINYAGEIFSSAAGDASLILTPNQQAMMLGAVQVAGAALASSVVEKFGRKPLLFITSLVSGLSMCTLASWFLARKYDVYAPNWIPIVTLCVCIFCDSSGLQPMSMVITGEIFSFKYRGTVLATTMATASLSDFVQMLFFKSLTSSVGEQVAFYFFGIVCLITAIYVLLVVPESKKRSLEDIYQDLKTKKERRKEEMEKEAQP